jgi:hypothetical protein
MSINGEPVFFGVLVVLAIMVILAILQSQNLFTVL